jgi:isopentenyl diphosphate isomerase/L-lactate dehydrogenase-like FMN-dependent dehydrogenase
VAQLLKVPLLKELGAKNKVHNVSDRPSDIEIIKQRKRDGIEIPLNNDVQAKTTSTYLEYVKLIHNALPELDYDEIDISTTFLKRKFSAPLIIDSMTGGAPEAARINGRLGELAEKYGFAMGLGSQRAGLESKELAETYSIARKNAPSAFLIANIGGAQLAKGLTIDNIKSAINVAGAGGTSWAGVEKLRAEASNNDLKIHLGEIFWDWGIPTAMSLIEVKKTVKVPIIASGGLRNGIEMAKCIVLGASMCAMAYPFLLKAAESKEELFNFADTVIAELKSTMFLIGTINLSLLKSSRYILTGPLADQVSNQ